MTGEMLATEEVESASTGRLERAWYVTREDKNMML